MQDPDETVRRARAFFEEVRTRRSYRDFSSEPVPREAIEYALRAAGSAPSGANLQPWHFVAVTDPETKRRVRAAAEEVERAFYEERATDDWLADLEPVGTDASKPFLQDAPVLIAVFRQHHTVDAAGELHKTYYPMESVGIATGMLLTALHHAGLATLVYTPAPMSFLRDILERPETEAPFALIAVGHPASGAIVPALERRPLEDIATFVE